MSDPIITLTTDFGEASPYVAAMKGVILGINPTVRIIDLSHQIPPQNIPHAAFFLAAAIPFFPAGSLHVVVVDPGVGSSRALLYVDVAGHRVLTPDNGCWTLLAGDLEPLKVIRLAEPRFWRSPVSPTFHGRDVLAPVAGHLSLGVDPDLLGPRVREWVRYKEPMPVRNGNEIMGEVVFVDHFGNLITNIAGNTMTRDRVSITVGDQKVSRMVSTYADVEPGTVAALVSSNDRLEIAINQGNAAHALKARVGTPVRVVS